MLVVFNLLFLFNFSLVRTFSNFLKMEQWGPHTVVYGYRYPHDSILGVDRTNAGRYVTSGIMKQF